MLVYNCVPPDGVLASGSRSGSRCIIIKVCAIAVIFLEIKLYRHSAKTSRKRVVSHVNYWRCSGLNIGVVEFTMSISIFIALG